MLRTLGWRVLHLPYFEWDRLQTSSAQDECLSRRLAELKKSAEDIFHASSSSSTPVVTTVVVEEACGPRRPSDDDDDDDERQPRHDDGLDGRHTPRRYRDWTPTLPW
jgi:hypothetical protein